MGNTASRATDQARDATGGVQNAAATGGVQSSAAAPDAALDPSSKHCGTSAAPASSSEPDVPEPPRRVWVTDLAEINRASYELANKVQAGRVSRGHSAEALQGGHRTESGVYTSGRSGWH